MPRMDVASSHPSINKLARWNGLDDKKFRCYISKVGGQEDRFNLCRATDLIIKPGKFAYFFTGESTLMDRCVSIE